MTDELPLATENLEWFKHAFNGTSHNKLSNHELKDRLARDNMERIIISVFNSNTFVISKLQESGTSPISEDELKQPSTIFNDLKPWDASL